MASGAPGMGSVVLGAMGMEQVGVSEAGYMYVSFAS